MGDTMVETQIIVGPDDLKSIGLQCTHCNATVVIGLDNPLRLPDSCPVCLTSWRQERSASVQYREFVEHLRDVYAAKGLPIRVQMMFDGENL